MFDHNEYFDAYLRLFRHLVFVYRLYIMAELYIMMQRMHCIKVLVQINQATIY
jgi:hypothetical protein